MLKWIELTVVGPAHCVDCGTGLPPVGPSCELSLRVGQMVTILMEECG